MKNELLISFPQMSYAFGAIARALTNSRSNVTFYGQVKTSNLPPYLFGSELIKKRDGRECQKSDGESRERERESSASGPRHVKFLGAFKAYKNQNRPIIRLSQRAFI